MITDNNPVKSTAAYHPCTGTPLATSLTCLLCLKRLSINSIAAAEYFLLFPLFCPSSSALAVGDMGVISAATCSLQSDGEDQTGCLNSGTALIGRLGVGGLALAKTKGLNGGARGLMSLCVAFGVGVKSSAVGLKATT